MKHIRSAENKLSDTKAYRYIIGALMIVSSVFLDVLKKLIEHSTVILMLFAFVGLFVVGQAFDDHAINVKVAILFILILLVLITTLIKLFVLERKKDDEF